MFDCPERICKFRRLVRRSRKERLCFGGEWPIEGIVADLRLLGTWGCLTFGLVRGCLTLIRGAKEYVSCARVAPS